MNTLLVIAKRPAPGQTKTRLTPPLSPEAAAQLYECFLMDTLDMARAVPGVERKISFAPEAAVDYFRKLAPDFGLVLQSGANLGERLNHALTDCLANGSQCAVITDSDSPTLPVNYVAMAFEKLGSADVVLGPCEDGGYYLVGLRRPQPRLFREVPMSTPRVLRETLALADQENLRVALLPAWYDVDTVQELGRLEKELYGSISAPATRRYLASLRQTGNVVQSDFGRTP